MSRARATWKMIFFSLALTFLILAAANPQIGSKLEEVKRKGSDIMIALDLSNSMLAKDLPPNRLEFARRSIAQLIERMRSDRLGIVVFAGDAYTQLPITTDYAAAKLFLNQVSTKIVPTQGTAIGAAIEQCIRSFNQESPAGKAIIVLTDGENHEDDAQGAASKAAELGINVYTVGLGSPSGAPLPLNENKNSGYRKDQNGQTIISKLNEEMLQEIAMKGNGAYTRATKARSGLIDIYQETQSLEKAEIGSRVYTDYEDRFQIFLAIALFFLFLDFLMPVKRSKWLDSINLFD
jgi:Ca-activated chloride channel family protein